MLLMNEGPKHPELLYRLIWPRGRYAERDPGNMHGGPSRGACAVNWHLGKMGDLVARYGQQDNPWQITAEGRAALRLDEHQERG
jgi:hypothetical protein